ncbi:MAG: nucleotide exchange factor GrpE [bacterium]
MVAENFEENVEGKEVDEENSEGSGEPDIIEISRERFKELQQKRDEFEDKYLRRTADLENLRKRQRREKNDLLKYASGDLLTDLLEIIDNFDRAFDSLQFENEEVREGMTMIRGQLDELLEKHHVRPIEAEGEPFNPHEHEGMMREDREDLDRQTVVEEFKKGYKLHDRILRPSAVKVGIPAEPIEQEKG